MSSAVSSGGRSLRRRIMRGGDGLEAASASLLVDMPRVGAGNGTGSSRDLLADARQEGYQEGYQAALGEIAAAEATGRSAQLRRVADSLVAAAGQLAEARVQAVQLGAVEAAELAYQLAEAFLQRELTIGQPVLDAVTRALGLVPDGEDLIVRLHPGDAIDPAELAALAPDVSMRIVPDPKVEPGGCVVVAGPCRVDAQIGAALARARQVLSELYPDQVGAGVGG
jgi:flagellar assembly protein FliH